APRASYFLLRGLRRERPPLRRPSPRRVPRMLRDRPRKPSWMDTYYERPSAARVRGSGGADPGNQIGGEAAVDPASQSEAKWQIRWLPETDGVQSLAHKGRLRARKCPHAHRLPPRAPARVQGKQPFL